MARQIKVEGYNAFQKTISDLESNKESVFVLFSGSKDPSTGHSWCPDCVAGNKKRPLEGLDAIIFLIKLCWQNVLIILMPFS